jgi:hypothetical protein
VQRTRTSLFVAQESSFQEVTLGNRVNIARLQDSVRDRKTFKMNDGVTLVFLFGPTGKRGNQRSSVVACYPLNFVLLRFCVCIPLCSREDKSGADALTRHDRPTRCCENWS